MIGMRNTTDGGGPKSETSNLVLGNTDRSLITDVGG